MNYRQVIITVFSALFVTMASAQNSFAGLGWMFDFKKDDKRSYIYMAGSSTVSPFMASVSEEFSRSQNLQDIPTPTPVVESVGTVEGFKMFCGGVGYRYPDFINASRPISSSELETCHKNGVKDVVAIKIGYDGIVIGNFIGRTKIKLTKEQIFLALAKEIYDPKSQKLISNPYNSWNEIDRNLPKKEITIYGPPLTSGTRDLFARMVMVDVCFNKKEFIAAYKDEDLRKEKCREIRGDGRFVESGENDDLIIEHLKDDHNAFGIFGFNFLVANKNIIQAAKIDNILPTSYSISSKKYELSRPLFVYFKKEHFALIPEMRVFIKEIINKETIGKKGYLIDRGLIPLSRHELKSIRKDILSQL